MYVIVEMKNVGSRDTVYRSLLATDSVYGGETFPYFDSEEKAIEFIGKRDDQHRNFKAIKLQA